jgi:Fe2+ or Zn2+ uptake regulation protein
MLKHAEKYEELLLLLNYRPHPMRLLVLRTLCAQEEFTDLHALSELMTASGTNVEKEKVRMILKRLNESGFLDRRGITGQNKFQFRLKEYNQLEQEIRSRISNQHQ